MDADVGNRGPTDGATSRPVSPLERVGLSARVETLCLRATDHPAVDGAGCLLIDGDGALRTAAATSVAARSLAAAEEMAGDGPCHETATTRRPRPEPVTLAAWPELETLLAGGPLRSVATAPIVCGRLVLGVFYVVSEREHGRSELFLADTTTTARHIGRAVRVESADPDASGDRDDDLGRQVAAGVANRPHLLEATAIISRQTGASDVHSGRRLRQLAEALDLPAVAVALHIVAQGRMPHLRELATDASERIHRQELARLALTDPLTGLANRVLLLDRLEHAVWRSQRAPGRPAVLYIDLDDFKRVNDTLGHDVGDHVLRTAAARIQSSVRPQDTVGRLGGDEFAVVCEAVDDPAIAVEIARRIARAVAEPITLEPVRGSTSQETAYAPAIGASIGIAVAEPDQPAAEILRAADLAMYRSKRGSEQITVFGERSTEGVASSG